MSDEILKSDRHNGMRKIFEVNYGDEELADMFERQNKSQIEVEAVEAAETEILIKIIFQYQNY